MQIKQKSFVSFSLKVDKTNIKIYNSRIEDLTFFKPTLITARALAPLNKLIKYVENYMKKSPSNSQNQPKLLFLKGKFYKNELIELSKTRDIKYQVYQSITDELGKIVYINNVNVLNIKNEKEI